MSDKKERKRLKGYVERHRRGYRQYLPWLLKQINELPTAECELKIQFPDSKSVHSLIVKRRGIIRSSDTVLVVFDYPSDGIEPELTAAHLERDSVHLIYCPVKVPFQQWLLMHRGIAEKPEHIPTVIEEIFGITHVDFDENPDAISSILGQLTLHDVHEASNLYWQTVADSSEILDDTFWRLTLPDLIRYLEAVGRGDQFTASGSI